MSRRTALGILGAAAAGAAVWRATDGLRGGPPATAVPPEVRPDALAPRAVGAPEGFRLGIVGAGIGGSVAAHYSRAALGPGARIVVFEREDRIGGRVRTEAFGGVEVEAGASRIHPWHLHLRGMAEALGLDRVPAPGPGEGASLGVWNGRELAVQTVNAGADGGEAAPYRGAPRRVREFVSAALARWHEVYRLQAGGAVFATPEALVGELGLLALARAESRGVFAEAGADARFLDEFLTGITRIDYGQGGSTNGLAAVLSLAAAGLVGGSPFSIAGGNVRLCERALEAAGAEVRAGVGVETIEGRPGPTGAEYVVRTDDGVETVLDALVVAAPLELSRVALRGFVPPPAATVYREFEVTYATLVAGLPDPAYFGHGTEAEMPETVLTVADPAIPFAAMERMGRSEGGWPLHRVFSREWLELSTAEEIFGEVDEMRSIRWDAHPVMRPADSWPPFVLGHRIYYLNAMESAVSTLETQAIAARNAVGMLAAELEAPSA